MNRPAPSVNRMRWLERHALSDEAMGLAYESLGGEGRTALKLCIARLFRLWGESARSERCEKRFAPDFLLVAHESPAPHALFVCDARYRHPAALLAAVMPALLAGVEEILPCFVQEEAEAVPSAPLLAAMELAGVERCFSAPAAGSEELFSLLQAENSQGRLVLLGTPPFGESLALAAHRRGGIIRSLLRPPHYTSTSSGRVMEQGFGPSLPDNTPADPSAGQDDCGEPLMQLDATHENVWLWHGLSPSWFRNRRMLLSS